MLENSTQEMLNHVCTFLKNYLLIWLSRVSAAAHRIFLVTCGILHCGVRASVVMGAWLWSTWAR